MIIHAENIEKSFGSLKVLKGVSFEASQGEVVSIITSQNLTRGNRCESAVVTTDLNIFNTLHGQIQDLIKNHSVPLNELFERRIAAD